MTFTPSTVEDMGKFFAAMAAFSAIPSDDVAVMRAFFDEVARLHIGQVTPRSSKQTLLEAPLPDMSRFLSALSLHAETRWAPVGRLDAWQVAGIKRNEVRNARVLAWILDPGGTHGRRTDILDIFVRNLRKNWEARMGRTVDPECFPFSDALNDCCVRTELSPFADASRRVDIVIDGRDFTVFIETKIDAPEGEGQVAAYLDLSRRRAEATGRTRWGVLFIAPRVAKNLSASDPRVIVAQ